MKNIKLIAALLSVATINLFSVNTFAQTYPRYRNEDWIKESKYANWGGSGYERFIDVKATQAGGIITAGYTDSTDVSPNYGGQDTLIVKYDKDLNFEWQAMSGGSGDDVFNNAIELSSGEFVGVGSSSSNDNGLTNRGDKDFLIVKYDADGNEVWAKTFGGNKTDYFSSIVEDSKGDLIAVGYSESTDLGVTNMGKRDAIIMKLDSNGNQKWIKSYGGSLHDALYSIAPTKSGDFIIAGASYSTNWDILNNNGGNEAFLLKINGDGEIIFLSSYGGSGNDSFSYVMEASNGDFVGFGYIASTDLDVENRGGNDGLFVRFDDKGNYISSASFGGSGNDIFWSGLETDSNEFLAVGYSDSVNAGFQNKGALDAVIVCYDSLGNEKWVKTWGEEGSDWFRAIIKLTNGEIIAVGHSNSVNLNYQNKGDYDAIIVKYNDLETEAVNIINSAIESSDYESISSARNIVNSLPESLVKDQLQEKLNDIFPKDIAIEKKTTSVNSDIYIVPKNALSLSLNTNAIIFDDVDGTQETELKNALDISVESSLPYELNATLPSQICNADKSSVLPSSALSIKESSKNTYDTFNNMNEKILIATTGKYNDKTNYSIDLKFNGVAGYKADIYKATIKFEVVQK